MADNLKNSLKAEMSSALMRAQRSMEALKNTPAAFALDRSSQRVRNLLAELERGKDPETMRRDIDKALDQLELEVRNNNILVKKKRRREEEG